MTLTPTAPQYPNTSQYPGPLVNWANFYQGNVQAPPPTPASAFNYASLGAPPTNAPPTGGWTDPQAWANYYQGTQGFTAPAGGNTPAAALGAANLASYSPSSPNLLGWEMVYGNPNTALQQNQSWAQSLGTPPNNGDYSQANGGWTNPSAWAAYYGGTQGFTAPTGANTPAAALSAAAALSQSSPYDPNLLGWEMDFGQPGNILAANPDWATSLGTPQTNAQGIGIPQDYNTGVGAWESPVAWAAYYGGIQGYTTPQLNTLAGAQSMAGVTNPNDPSLLGWELDYGNPQTVINTITSSPQYIAYQQALAQYNTQNAQQIQAQQDFLAANPLYAWYLSKMGATYGQSSYNNFATSYNNVLTNQTAAQTAAANADFQAQLDAYNAQVAATNAANAAATASYNQQVAAQQSLISSLTAQQASLQNLINVLSLSDPAAANAYIVQLQGIESQLGEAQTSIIALSAPQLMDAQPFSYNNPVTGFSYNVAQTSPGFIPSATLPSPPTAPPPVQPQAQLNTQGLAVYNTIGPDNSQISLLSNGSIVINGQQVVSPYSAHLASGGFANVTGSGVNVPSFGTNNIIGSGGPAGAYGSSLVNDPFNALYGLYNTTFAQAGTAGETVGQGTPPGGPISPLFGFHGGEGAFGGGIGAEPVDTGIGDVLAPTIDLSGMENFSNLDALVQYLTPAPVESAGGLEFGGPPAGPDMTDYTRSDLGGMANLGPDWTNLPSINDLAQSTYGWLSPPASESTFATIPQQNPAPFYDPLSGLPMAQPATPAPPLSLPNLSELLPNWLTGYPSANIPDIQLPRAPTGPGVAITQYAPLEVSVPPGGEISPQAIPNIGPEPTFAPFQAQPMAPPGPVPSPAAMPEVIPGFGAPELYQGGYGQPTQEDLQPPAPFSKAEQFVQKVGPSPTLQQVATAYGHPVTGAEAQMVGESGLNTPLDLSKPLEPQITAAIGGTGLVAGQAIPRIMSALAGAGITPQGLMDVAGDVKQDVEEGPGAYGSRQYTTTPIYGDQTGYNPTGLVPPADIPNTPAGPPIPPANIPQPYGPGTGYGTYAPEAPIQAGYTYPSGTFAGGPTGIQAGYSYVPGSFGEIDPYNFSSAPYPAGGYGGGATIGAPPYIPGPEFSTPGSAPSGYSYPPGSFGEVPYPNELPSAAPYYQPTYDVGQGYGGGQVPGVQAPFAPPDYGGLTPEQSTFASYPPPQIFYDPMSGLPMSGEPLPTRDRPEPIPADMTPGLSGQVQYGFPEPTPLGFTSPDYGVLPGTGYTAPVDLAAVGPYSSQAFGGVYGGAEAPNPFMEFGQPGEAVPDPVAVAEARGVPPAQGGGNIRGLTSIAAVEQDPASMAAIQRFAAAFPNVENPLTQLYSLIQGESSFNGNAVTGQYRGYFQMNKSEAHGDPVGMTFAQQMDAYTNRMLEVDPTGQNITNLGLFNAASAMRWQTDPLGTVVYPAHPDPHGYNAANATTWGRYSPGGVGGDITIGGIERYYARGNPQTSAAIGAVGAPQPFIPVLGLH